MGATGKHWIVRALRTRIESGEWPAGRKLPSTRDLARAFGVARETLRIALSELEREGWIEGRPKSGFYVTPEAGAELESPGILKELSGNKPERIAQSILEDISRGDFAVGDFIPPRKQLQHRYKASPACLRKALSIAEESGFVQRRGSAIIAGPRLGTGPAIRGSIRAYFNLWSIQTERRPWHRFLISLERNVAPLGLRVQPSPSWDFTVEKGQFLGEIPPETRAIVCMIRFLPDLAKKENSAFRQEIRKALKLRIPVIIFGLDPFPNVSCQSLFGPCSNLFLFQIDNKQTGSDAAAYCLTQGHHAAAFFSFSTEAWSRERYQGFAWKFRSTLKSKIKVLELSAKYDKLASGALRRNRNVESHQALREPIKSLLNGFEFSHPRYYNRIFPLIRRLALTDTHWPHLEPLFEKALTRHSQIKLWMCADETVGLVAADYLRRKNLKIRKHIHLMALDDMPEMTHLGITALSLNWERMGYLAAHAALGDIPIRRKRNRVVICPHAVIDRGSVGRMKS